MEFLTNLFKPKYEIVANDSINEQMEIPLTMTKTKKITVDELIDTFLYKPKNIDELLKTCDNETKLNVLREKGVSTQSFLKRIILSITNYPDDMILLCAKNRVNIKVIELIQHKINLNAVDEKGRTCLWLYHCYNDVEYLIQLVNSNIKFNLNHQNILGNTFFATFLSSDITKKQLSTMINLLIAKNFQFNTHSSYSLMDHVLVTNKSADSIAELIKCNQIDIINSSVWLHELIHNYKTVDVEHVMNVIRQRVDYRVFLNHMLIKYGLLYATADQDFTFLMTLFLYENQNQLADMINYVNEHGNNILHLASQYHLDRIIRFIMTHNQERYHLLIKNKEGKTPHDLYFENDISKLLHTDIKLL